MRWSKSGDRSRPHVDTSALIIKTVLSHPRLMANSFGAVLDCRCFGELCSSSYCNKIEWLGLEESCTCEFDYALKSVEKTPGILILLFPRLNERLLWIFRERRLSCES